jgi:hypothetical protein
MQDLTEAILEHLQEAGRHKDSLTGYVSYSLVYHSKDIAAIILKALQTRRVES